MKTAKIRSLFIEFFKNKDHTIVPSSPLVPANDPTLLFTNAGMVQFKDIFLGNDNSSFSRAVSSQKCVRAGGKHNDLENVGFTARHHTFFEMLGNFSFGDYFKKQAIEYSWEFITKVLKLSEDKLWVTVYKDDKESEDIWLNHIKVDKNRFVKCGDKDNFWSMGDVGPCGPCTEIFYDHGESVAGGPPGSKDAEGDRYVEVWNLVFMQYNRDKSGKLSNLPKPSVDTGMGLERIAAVMQGVHTNYDIDLFKNLISAAAKILAVTDLNSKSLRVIVDHLRACTFLVIDGVIPSNEGRGYVLRRIMRRAIRHGRKLGATKPFFYKLVKFLVKEMSEAYPELITNKAFVEEVILKEENQFGKTLEQGLKLLDLAVEDLNNKVIPGDIAFKLYDTYGFPIDLTQDIAKEQDMEVDMHGFEQAMLAQRQRARKASSFESDDGKKLATRSKSQFIGYDSLTAESNILEIFVENSSVDSIQSNQKAAIVLETTPFYAESAGQVGDKGVLKFKDNLFEVHDTQKVSDSILHYGKVVKGSFKVQDKVTAAVDKDLRMATVRNHSVTHLLHAALKHVLGSHVVQKGSVVDPNRTRFDFSHNAALTHQELKDIEFLVNDKILENSEVKKEIMPIEQAKEMGACALFGEKYEKNVRVLTMGNGFSIELCGGTHANRTGDIGSFKILSESGISAGIRRIEATTGHSVSNIIASQQHTLEKIGLELKADPSKVLERVKLQNSKIKDLEKEIKKLKATIASGGAEDVLANVKEIAGIKVLATKIEHADNNTLRDTVDKFKNKLQTAVVVLASDNDGKVSIVVGVTKDNTKLIKAGELVNFVASQVGGKGGGRDDMAMAGGTNPSNIKTALLSVFNWVKEKTNTKSE